MAAISSEYSAMTPPQKGMPPRRVPIAEMAQFDLEVFIRDYKTLGKPVVFKGAAAAWPAVTQWTPAYFAERFGDKQVTPSLNLPDTEVPYQYRDADYRQPMRLAEFVGHMTGERCYVDQVSVGFFEGIADDYRFNEFGMSDVKDILFWMGSNTRSGLHYDYVENFFAQVCGTKLAILAAPEEARNLHLFADSHTKSQVAVEHPDLQAHPRLGLATFQQAVLEPGDVLYLPRGWWHYFASSENSISLACWHGEPLTPDYDVKLVLGSRNWAIWACAARDFLWHGILRRPYRRRLYSPPPTGVMLYDLVSRLWVKT